MARLRSSPYSSPFRLLGLCFIGMAFLISLASASLSPSPLADGKVELICHTANPADCYPKIFVPTDQFQVVHEDQDLPPGLHVRLNVQTGLKEAKLYDPTEEMDPALKGLPVDRSVVVVEPEEEDGSQEVMKPPRGAPEYDPVGRVKKPQTEASIFYDALKGVKGLVYKGKVADDVAFAETMEGLEDLSHDIYYGLKIAEDADALKALFCMLTQPGGEWSRQAAAIVGAAVQNNPSALKELVKVWDQIMGSKCGGQLSGAKEAFYGSSLTSVDPKTAKAKVAAFNGVIKNKSIRDEFLASGGMDRLLEVLLQESSQEWESVKQKVGHLVMDNFLDEGMGATLGVWPKKPMIGGASECRGEGRLDEGCWAYHLKNIMKENKSNDDHWSRELYARLVNQARANAAREREL